MGRAVAGWVSPRIFAGASGQFESRCIEPSELWDLQPAARKKRCGRLRCAVGAWVLLGECAAGDAGGEGARHSGAGPGRAMAWGSRPRWAEAGGKASVLQDAAGASRWRTADRDVECSILASLSGRGFSVASDALCGGQSLLSTPL